MLLDRSCTGDRFEPAGRSGRKDRLARISRRQSAAARVRGRRRHDQFHRFADQGHRLFPHPPGAGLQTLHAAARGVDLGHVNRGFRGDGARREPLRDRCARGQYLVPHAGSQGWQFRPARGAHVQRHAPHPPDHGQTDLVQTLAQCRRRRRHCQGGGSGGSRRAGGVEHDSRAQD